MRVLAIDSSAISASCVLTQDGVICSECYVNNGLTHSQTLMPMVESVLRQAGCTLAEVDGLAVNVGPGSFTGVRIGVATVKGLAVGAGLPCVGVSTLESMAYLFEGFSGIVCAVMDARCNQVYNALFRVENGEPMRLCEDRALSIAQLEQELLAFSEPIYLAGDGRRVCLKAFGASVKGIVNLPEHLCFQRASGTARAAEEKLARGEAVDAAALMPVYLRLPQAERELRRRRQEEGLQQQ